MIRRLSILAAVTAMALAAPVGAFAHHSFAMFDSARTVTLNGTVKDFQWTNPHAVIWVYADVPSGPPQLWSVELTSPGNLVRQGWTRLELKPGDKIAIEISPLRDGSPGGSFKQMTNLQTGKTLGIPRVGS